jgi:hypothetical protein
MMVGCSQKNITISEAETNTTVLEPSSNDVLVTNEIISNLPRLDMIVVPKPHFSKTDYMKLEQHQKERALTIYILELNSKIKGGNKQIVRVNEWLSKYILKD